MSGGGPASMPSKQDMSLLENLAHENMYFGQLELFNNLFVRPLRNWDTLDPQDRLDMFSNIDDIFKISKRAIAIKQVDTTDAFQKLKMLFSPSMIKQYTAYLNGFPRIELALQRCQQNEQFNAYLKTKQNESNAYFERLLWQPLERVGTYNKLLKTAIAACPDGHDCKAELTKTFVVWQTLDANTERMRTKRKNEDKLLNVELSFPHERLNLGPHLNVVDGGAPDGGVREGASAASGGSTAPSPSKRRWSMATVVKRLTSDSGKLTYNGGVMDAETAAEAKLGEVELRTHKSANSGGSGGGGDGGAAHEGRQFVVEGSVVFSKVGKPDTEDKNRSFVFLFSDMLLIAKAKGRGTYVLKDRMDLAEAWIGPSPATPFKGFTVGAPHCRARHVLTTPPEANMNCQQWHDKIARTMAEAKAKAGKQAAPRNCNVYPFIPEKSKAAQANSSLPTFLPIEIAIMDTMATVIRKVLEQLAVADPKPDNYSIYEISEYGLQKCASFASPLALLTAGGRASIHRSRCHFVVRPAQATPLRVDMLPPNVQSLVVHSSPKKGSPGKKSGKWSDWGKSAKAMLPKKIFGGGGGGGGGGSDGKRKGPVGTAVLPKYKAPANAAGPRGASSGCLYGKVLADVMVDGELPLPVQNMLVRLYQDGPMAKGLFRVSANAKLLRQVKERLDTGQEVDMVEVPILAVGATLKEYLRNMPDSCFPVKMYHDFIACNNVEVVADRTTALKELLDRLPAPNSVLLKAIVPVLLEICARKEENEMTPRNIGICIGQSLMCPPTTEDVLKNDVPPFIEFMLTHAEAVFGAIEPLPKCIKISGEGYLEIMRQGEALEESGEMDNDDRRMSIGIADGGSETAAAAVAAGAGGGGAAKPNVYDIAADAHSTGPAFE